MIKISIRSKLRYCSCVGILMSILASPLFCVSRILTFPAVPTGYTHFRDTLTFHTSDTLEKHRDTLQCPS
jgi:hypothetical protein